MTSRGFLSEGKLIAAALLLCALYFGITQPTISLGQGHPYDSDYYVRLAEQVALGEQLSTQKPFVYRIGFPYLVGTLFPRDLMAGFRWLGLGFGCAGLSVLCSLLCRCLRERRTAYALVLLFALSPMGPLRQPHFYPAHVDLPALFFVLCMLRISVGRAALRLPSSLALAGLALLGVTFRESVCLAALAIFLGRAWVYRPGMQAGQRARLERASWQQMGLAGLPLAFALLGILLTQRLVEAQGSYSFFEQPPYVLGLLLENLSIYPLAWLTAYGPMLFLALAGLWQTGAGLLRCNPVILFYGLSVMLAAATAGTHTDRFTLWAFPLVYLLLGQFLENHPVMGWETRGKLLWFVPLAVAQALAFRLLAPLPDDTFGALKDPGLSGWICFAPYGEGANSAQMFAAYMSSEGRLILLVQYLLLCVYLLLLLAGRRASSEGRPWPPASPAELGLGTPPRAGQFVLPAAERLPTREPIKPAPRAG